MQAGARPSRADRRALGAIAAVVATLVAAPMAARAAAADDLRDFVQKARSGRANFTQTVTAPDGVKQKVSTGHFEFQRPGRFRFSYLKPYAQTIVGDGAKVWVHDPDLNQVSVRKLGDALGSTPAALLVSGAIEPAFTLSAQPEADGLQWVMATPRAAAGGGEGTVRWLRAGFRDHQLAALEIADSFGQRSRLVFTGLELNPALPADTFRFTPPAGADVSEQ